MILLVRFLIPHSLRARRLSEPEAAFPACPAGRRIPNFRPLFLILTLTLMWMGLPVGSLQAMPPVECLRELLFGWKEGNRQWLSN